MRRSAQFWCCMRGSDCQSSMAYIQRTSWVLVEISTWARSLISLSIAPRFANIVLESIDELLLSFHAIDVSHMGRMANIIWAHVSPPQTAGVSEKIVLVATLSLWRGTLSVGHCDLYIVRKGRRIMFLANCVVLVKVCLIISSGSHPKQGIKSL